MTKNAKMRWLRDISRRVSFGVALVIGTTGIALASESAGGLPQLNPATMPTQLFWLVTSFFILYVMLSGVALPRVGSVLEERGARIAFDIAKAGELQTEAESLQADIKHRLEVARSHSRELLTQSSKEAASAHRLLLAELETQLLARTTDAVMRIQAARSIALSNLNETATEIAEVAVERLAGITVDKARIASMVTDVTRTVRVGARVW